MKIVVPPFNNRFSRELPGDPERINRRRTVAACYAAVAPTPVSAPKLLGWSSKLATELALPEAEDAAENLVDLFAGNTIPPTCEPYACNYGGHQFGVWAGQLGDGRAINLGELKDRQGLLQTLQLKGAGATPFSRQGDGRAVLRSSLREFICSEAMYHLGIPTTRALSLVASGETVLRDMFYDGHPKGEPGAVVCRVAESFLRFGNFELAASRNDKAQLEALARFALKHHFSHLGPLSSQSVTDLFVEVAARTATLVTAWMGVGFVHGVLNSDNMSLLGLTIDYGPYGWLEEYDPDWTPNTSDLPGRRYRFGLQPQVAAWNLTRLAEALFPLVEDGAALQTGLDRYADDYRRQSLALQGEKLGLRDVSKEDAPLLAELPPILQQERFDMTLFYRALATIALEGEGIPQELVATSYAQKSLEASRPALSRWLTTYRARLRRDGEEAETRQARMNRVNPRFVPRNWLLHEAIVAAESGDLLPLKRLQRVFQSPYDEQPQESDLARLQPPWARQQPGCAMLSCSS